MKLYVVVPVILSLISSLLKTGKHLQWLFNREYLPSIGARSFDLRGRLYRLLAVRCVSSDSVNNTGIRIHVQDRKRQTSDSSWEFLTIENKQIKTVRTILVVKTGIKLATYFV